MVITLFDPRVDNSVNLRVKASDQVIVDTEGRSHDIVIAADDKPLAITGKALVDLGVAYFIPEEIVEKEAVYGASFYDEDDDTTARFTIYVSKTRLDHVVYNDAQRSKLKKYIDAVAEASGGTGTDTEEIVEAMGDKILKAAKEYADEHDDDTCLWTKGDDNTIAVKLDKGSFSSNSSVAEGRYNTASGTCSHAEGNTTIASGNISHAEGQTTTASGQYSHAEGTTTTALGEASHAEGYQSTASGHASHAEGNCATASGQTSHAEGADTVASGRHSHAEGYQSTAFGDRSHAEGVDTVASGYCSHAEGVGATALGFASHAEGCYTVAPGSYSHVECGQGVSISLTYIGSNAYEVQRASSNDPLTENDLWRFRRGARIVYSPSGGPIASVGITRSRWNTTKQCIVVTLSNALPENISGIVLSGATAGGESSHSEGQYTIASGSYSHAEGDQTRASVACAHSEGGKTSALGIGSHAEGLVSIAAGNYSHAEGSTFALGDHSHAEGGMLEGVVLRYEGNSKFTVTRYYSLETGDNLSIGDLDGHSGFGFVHPSGGYAIVNSSELSIDRTTLVFTIEGTGVGLGGLGQGDIIDCRLVQTTATGEFSHAEGLSMSASGIDSHAEGNSTIAASRDQHVQGRFNIEDAAGTYAHIVGNGTESARSNAHTLDWQGNAWFAGSLSLGSTTVTEAQLQALLALLNQ